MRLFVRIEYYTASKGCIARKDVVYGMIKNNIDLRGITRDEHLDMR